MSQNPAQFLVVGVGASAGGVDALQRFFANVPGDSGCAYVVILHLSPQYDSQLAAVLQAVTALPATPVTERVPVAPDHIYVVPPNQHLTMVDGEVRVSPDLLPEERRAPIDLFFRTLAETHRGRGVCVILSGTGADGSMGLKRVKERGGAVFVQNPREAAFAEMPRSAIATDLVDDVLPVAAIPARIAAYRASLGTITIAEEAEQRPEVQQQALREVFAQLRARTGHDFTNYKRATMLRRIERRISVRRLPDLPAYAGFLRNHPDEVQALLKDLLISVTNFFRDREAFTALEQDILPRLFHGKGADAQVRLWVVGCATGEEAYSLAMLCAERTFDLLDTPSFQIFASDIDETAIAHGREGLYTTSDLADVSPERLRRFFTREDGRYRVRRELRETVLFANHNILKDPPFSHIDLVSCRNVLIYLDRTAQERVMETLHFALKPGGYLFLGTSESTDGASDLFATVNREQHIFQHRAVGTRPLPLPDTTPILRIGPPRIAPLELPERSRERISGSDLHQQLLEQYAPPSIVVNQDFTIIHISERAGRYLQVSGELSADLVQLVRPELRLELRGALAQALQRRTKIDVSPLPVRIENRNELVTIRVRPVFRADDPTQGYLLVLFEAGAKPPSAAELLVHGDEPATRQLEEENARLRRQLRTSSEQYEYQAEELRATNEELQALNEELRSSTRKLETSKEELQSINEELRTVNQELKAKVEEATLHSTNLQNLVNAAEVGTIFLDRSLHIKLFTPAARALFNLIPADYGRPLSDITHLLLDVDVLADAQQVLMSLQMIEREVRTTTGAVYLLRVLPYRMGEDRIGGVVITFFDITARVQAEDALRASEARFRALVTASSYALYRMSPDWSEMLHLDGQGFIANTESPSASWLDVYIHPADQPDVLVAIQEAVREKRMFELEHRVRRVDGTLGWTLSRAVPLLDEHGAIVEWFGAASDVTARKAAEEALRDFDDITERRAHEKRQAFLLTLSDALRVEPDADAVANRALGMLSEQMQLDRCYIGVYRLADDRGDFTHQVSNDRVPPLPDGVRLSDFPEALRVAFDQTLVIDDVAQTAGLTDTDRRNLGALGLRALVAATLRKGEHNPLWSIVAVSARPRRWTEGEVALIEEVTERTWAAIERARAEVALRESEARHRALFAAVDAGVCLFERLPLRPDGLRDYRYLAMNPAMQAMFGIPDLSGQSIRDNFPDEVEDWYDDYDRVLATGQPIRFERETIPQGMVLEMFVTRVEDASGQRLLAVMQNVTARKRAEEALRESEERQAFLLKLSDALRSLTDAVQIQTTAARTLGEYLGVTRAMYTEVTGEPGAEVGTLRGRYHAPEQASPDGTSLPPFPEQYRYDMYGEQVMALRRRGETMVVADVTVDPRFNAAERAAWVAGGVRAAVTVALVKAGRFVVDFGVQSAVPRAWTAVEVALVEGTAERTWAAVERTRAEQALRESEGRLRALVENLPGGAAFIVDQELRYQLAEGEALHAAGIEPQAYIGKTIFEALPPDLATSYEPIYRQALAGKAFLHEHAAHGRSYISRGIPLHTASGEVYAVLAVSYDISDRKRAEEALRESEARFRTLADTLPQLIWTNDGAGNAIYFNQRWFDYSGLSLEQSLGLGWQAIIHPEDEAGSVERWQQALARGESFETEYRLRGADGRYRWYLGRNVPLHNTSGAIIGWFGSATDIEELKQAEEARHESAMLRRMAEAQEEERLRIARDLHDQLGQLITGLLLQLKQMEEPAQGTAVAALLPPVQATALDLAKEAHRTAVNLRPTALEDLGLVPALKRLVADWSAQAGVPGAFESVGLNTQRLPRTVEVVLFRVVQEALTNVQKHAQATNVSVVIEQRGDQVILVVEDNGRGFAAEEPATDEARPRLGLLGIYERITQVGGTVELETAPASGTTLFIRVPLAVQQ